MYDYRQVPINSTTTAHRYDIISTQEQQSITVPLIKTHLRIAQSVLTEDDYLTLLLKAAISLFEKYTGVTLQRTIFKTYRDSFNTKQFILLKTPFINFITFEYLKEGIDTSVDANLFYFADSGLYAHIILHLDEEWPTDADIQKEALIISFEAGLADDTNFIPAAIQLALLNIIAYWYENRGDCTLSASDVIKLPPNAVTIFNSYRIIVLNSYAYNEGVSNYEQLFFR